MKLNKNTSSYVITKEMVKNKSIDINKLNESELNLLIDDILCSFDPDNFDDTQLLDECYKRLGLLCENTKILSSDRYMHLAESIVNNYDENLISKHVSFKRSNIRKKLVLVLFAAILSISLSGCCIANILGFNIVDLGKRFFSFPEKESIEKENIEIIWTTDNKQYPSIQELVLAENIDIMYPISIPNEYELVFSEYSNLGEESQVLFKYVAKNNIIELCYILDFSTDLPNDSIYSVNGIDYVIAEVNNMHIATWIYNGHYHSLKCSEKETMYKIISEMKGFSN